MAYNEKLTNRVREALVDVAKVEEKSMFRGVAFMVNEKMCVTVGDDEIMCRIDPAIHDAVLEKRGTRTMIMRGREYKGYIMVHSDGIKTKKNLDYYINLALEYNKIAKASKKRKKK